MPTFDPAEPLDLAVWRSNAEQARDNLRHEIREALRLLVAADNALLDGRTPLTSELRRFAAVAFELTRYGVELNTLLDNRPTAPEGGSDDRPPTAA